MRTRLNLPVSALSGAVVMLQACLFSGMQSPGGLDKEDREILRHMSIVYLPDGFGGTVKAIRCSHVNVQIVNGLDSTREPSRAARARS